MNVQYIQVHTRGPEALSVECPRREICSQGFNPGLQHTKVFKNGTSCSSVSTQTYEEELGLVDYEEELGLIEAVSG